MTFPTSDQNGNPAEPSPPSSTVASEAAAALATKLKALGFYDHNETRESAFARILVMGAPKTGKTTAVLTTAPGPIVVLNCDGDSALKYPAKLGAAFFGIDVSSVKSLGVGRQRAKAAVDAGARTVVLDSLSILADRLLAELAITKDGFELFGDLGKEIMRTVSFLMDLPAHVFFISHMCRGYEEEGIIPLIAGKSAQKIPAYVHDVVRFDYNAERRPERMFLIGPQKDWSYAGRNIKRTCAVPANVLDVFAELGIAP